MLQCILSAINRHLSCFQVLFVFTITNNRLMNIFTHSRVKVSPGKFYLGEKLLVCEIDDDNIF